MSDFAVKEGKKLRKGYTTGACAAAAAKAAALMLLCGEEIRLVEIGNSQGERLYLPLSDWEWAEGGAVRCTVVKDAGDDPDVTNGIRITVGVRKCESGVWLYGGEGIGTVTKPGLRCPVGAKAINPGPQKMIRAALTEIMEKAGYSGGLEVLISARDGAKIAKHTFNPHMGIVGGISILGTTGIVEPMSEEALIKTIQTEMDTILAEGGENLLLCPGNYGKEVAEGQLGLDFTKGVKCSNYIGETLDYAVYKKVKNILLVGHAGKLSKLAAGIMNTHSKVADCRCEIFAAHAALLGADRALIAAIMEAASTSEIHRLLCLYGMAEKVWDSILQKMLQYLERRVHEICRVEVILFVNEHEIVVQSKGAMELCQKLKGEGN
ncbi:cobalt-precorrin-5B (C(1))-methyltransferase CbiD [Fumia xinanensis]|uniref:Cobalt-precorrin-5B C(1)-methyltransferase n=1 Tax=Fumia xinanensis TaxID=2763659 RepID=A0A926E0M4_9FIRM|nr:cobalamin biosynthesis protein CbiD [Fumia xinanensis]